MPSDARVRAARLVRLMRALDSGSYEPDPRKVAEALLRALALSSLCGDYH